MRRCAIVLLMLLSLIAASSAQTPTAVTTLQTVVADFVGSASAPPAGKATADDVTARIMVFDRDHDGKIARDELSERMQPLMILGDRNVDGVLDEGEIRAVAASPSAPQTFRGFPGSGGYGFGDQPGTSSRLHFEGALDDLRLAGATREQAQAIVKRFVDAIESTASSNLLTQMESVLTPAQLAEFSAALERQRRPLTVRTSNDSTPHVMFISMDLPRFIRKYALPPAENQLALAAIEKFNAEFRPGPAERAELVEQMKGILSDEERDNFRAALDRRPLSKGGLVMGISGGVVGGVVGSAVGSVPEGVRRPTPPLPQGSGAGNNE
jgi:hypothetical protein